MLLTEEMKGTVTPVLVLGDLNDGDGSNTLNVLTEQPRYLAGAHAEGETLRFTPRRLCSSVATPATSSTRTSS